MALWGTCDLDYQQREPTVIFEDNTPAIKWSSGSSRRAKHIDLKVCFVHEFVSMKQAILEYLPTAEQVADILAKHLEAHIVSFFCTTSLASREEVCWHKLA
jgi:hypothetical protein